MNSLILFAITQILHIFQVLVKVIEELSKWNVTVNPRAAVMMDFEVVKFNFSAKHFEFMIKLIR